MAAATVRMIVPSPRNREGDDRGKVWGSAIDRHAGRCTPLLTSRIARPALSIHQPIFETVTFGEINEFARKGVPVYVNGNSAGRACRVGVVTCWSQRVTASQPRRAALSVRGRDVRGPIETRRVALEPRMKAFQTLALSR